MASILAAALALRAAAGQNAAGVNPAIQALQQNQQQKPHQQPKGVQPQKQLQQNDQRQQLGQPQGSPPQAQVQQQKKKKKKQQQLQQDQQQQQPSVLDVVKPWVPQNPADIAGGGSMSRTKKRKHQRTLQDIGEPPTPPPSEPGERTQTHKKQNVPDMLLQHQVQKLQDLPHMLEQHHKSGQQQQQQQQLQPFAEKQQRTAQLEKRTSHQHLDAQQSGAQKTQQQPDYQSPSSQLERPQPPLQQNQHQLLPQEQKQQQLLQQKQKRQQPPPQQRPPQQQQQPIPHYQQQPPKNFLKVGGFGIRQQQQQQDQQQAVADPHCIFTPHQVFAMQEGLRALQQEAAAAPTPAAAAAARGKAAALLLGASARRLAAVAPRLSACLSRRMMQIAQHHAIETDPKALQGLCGGCGVPLLPFLTSSVYTKSLAGRSARRRVTRRTKQLLQQQHAATSGSYAASSGGDAYRGLSVTSSLVSVCKLCGHRAETATGPLRPATQKQQQQQQIQQHQEAPPRGAAFNRQKRCRVQRRPEQRRAEQHQQQYQPADAASSDETPLTAGFLSPKPEEAVSLLSSKEKVDGAPECSAVVAKLKSASFAEEHAVPAPSVRGVYPEVSPAEEMPSPALLPPVGAPSATANPQIASQCGKEHQGTQEAQWGSFVRISSELKEGDSQGGSGGADGNKRNEPAKSVYAVLAELDC